MSVGFVRMPLNMAIPGKLLKYFQVINPNGLAQVALLKRRFQTLLEISRINIARVFSKITVGETAFLRIRESITTPINFITTKTIADRSTDQDRNLVKKKIGRATI